jgi:hypothetical protein
MRATRRTFAAALSVTLGISGCARARPDPVPLAGDPVEMNKLAGSWSGEYSGVESGRSGSILFTLRADADTAYGDVVMTAKPSAVRARDAATGTGATAQGQAAQTLSISFVRVADGGVSGRLAPYLDPSLGVTVQTTFIGRFVTPDRLEGTFTTTGPGNTVHQGRWRVNRDR